MNSSETIYSAYCPQLQSERDLPDRVAFFDRSVSVSEISSVELSEALPFRRPQRPRFNEAGHFVQQIVLRLHVAGLEHRPREHQLPADCGALALKRVDVHRPLGFDDKAQLALGF